MLLINFCIGMAVRAAKGHIPNTKIDEEHFVLDLYPIHLPFEETELTDNETPEI